MTEQTRYKTIKHVTIIGAIVNALQGFAKLFGGIYMHSHALVADGIHSFSDLITDVMVIIGAKYGSISADATHPYGHQRIETATTLFLSILLILAGVAIGWDAFHEILHRQEDFPNPWALALISAAIIANEMLFQYTYRTGKRIQSELLIANAWHHRADALSSLVVLIGLIGTLLGYKSFDAIAAIIVSLLIIKIGVQYGWSSIRELVDTAVEPELLSRIETTIKQVPGVIKIHQLRSRSMAGNIFIDVHIQVTPWISVSEGHFIAQNVHQTLVLQYERINDVTVHVDPEDDEISSPSHHLPQRAKIEALLNPWKNQYPELQNFIIHYLNGQVTIDLIFNSNLELDFFQEHITADLQQFPHKISFRYFVKL